MLEVVDQHQLPATRVAKGQVLWLGVAINAKGAYGRGLEDAPLTPVVLTLVNDEDLQARKRGEAARAIRKRQVERVLREAYAQGAVLGATDVALLLNMSPGWAAGCIREIEAEKKQLLPTRGSVHDLGPKTTHKAQIVRMVKVEKVPPPEVARRTHHSLPDVDRYLNDYERVAKLARTLSAQDISFVTMMSLSLVQEYLGLIADISKPGGER